MLALVTTNVPPFEATDPDASDAELVARLLARDLPARQARRRAHELLDAAGGLYGLVRAPQAQLLQHGIAPEAVEALQAALVLGRRAAIASPPERALDAATVGTMFRELLAGLAHEEMHVVLLDRALRWRGRRRIASGGSAAVTVFAADALAPVLEARAPAFVLVHNHPSGSCIPSAHDVALSDRIARCGEVLGIVLVDHLVVAQDGHASAMHDAPRWTPPRTRGTS